MEPARPSVVADIEDPRGCRRMDDREALRGNLLHADLVAVVDALQLARSEGDVATGSLASAWDASLEPNHEEEVFEC